jgi:hypothetical protein
VRRLVTLGPLSTHADLEKAAVVLETGVNKLADAVGVSGKLADLVTRVAQLRNDLDALVKEVGDQHASAGLTPVGHLVGPIYTGAVPVNIDTDAQVGAVPETLVARDDQAHSEFASVKLINDDLTLILERSEDPAAILQLVSVRRNDTDLFFLGFNADDALVWYDDDQTTELLKLDDTGRLTAETEFKAVRYLDQNDNQLLTDQQPAIAHVVPTTGSPGGSGGTGGTPSDPATLGDVDGAYAAANALVGPISDLQGTVSDLVAAINTLLATGETHGFIAT